MPVAATALLAVCAAVATWRCRAMASKTHVRSAVVTACVVSVKRGSNRGGIDRTPLTWFHMLRAVGLATMRPGRRGGNRCGRCAWAAYC